MGETVECDRGSYPGLFYLDMKQRHLVYFVIYQKQDKRYHGTPQMKIDPEE